MIQLSSTVSSKQNGCEGIKLTTLTLKDTDSRRSV
jgi:hypothetical protein